jgi:MAF protein
VLRLARGKALASSKDKNDGRLVLAADTIVADGSQLLGKPYDADDASVMLRNLRGRSHQVYTALALCKGDEILTDLCVSQVPMRVYSDDEIEAYVASGDPLDKAGAYAIQHTGFKPVVDFSGCFASVTGMPLCHLLRSLHKAGIPTGIDAPRICLEHFDYNCRISEGVLSGVIAG